MLKYFEEIKNRIFLILVVWLSTFIICYFYKEVLLFLIAHFLNKKALDQLSFHFIFTNVTELFKVYLTLTEFLSIQVTYIYILLSIYLFFSPAFFRLEHTYLRSIARVVLLLWCISTVTLNTILVPITWDFFLSFRPIEHFAGSLDFHFEAKLSENIDFYIFLYYTSLVYLQGFALLVSLFGFVNNKICNIKKFRKIFYYFLVVFSTGISSQDIVSFLLVGTFVLSTCEFLLLVYVLKFKFNYLVRQPIKTYKNSCCQ